MAWHTTIARRSLLALCPALCVAALAACAGAPPVFTDLSSGTPVDLDRLVRTAGERRVVFIGEAHDSPRDHAVQLAVIRRLEEEGREVSVALEMFTPADQEVLNAWVGGTLDETTFHERYARGWEMPYGYYRDIFLYARQRGVPLLGINADRQFVGALAREGLRSVPAEVLDMLNFTPCARAPEYAAAIGMSGMSARHGSDMGHLCDAQRYRDSLLAYNISRILTARRGTLVVLLGTGHAMKQAVPSLLATHTEVPTVVLLPRDVRMLSGREPGPETADFIW